MKSEIIENKTKRIKFKQGDLVSQKNDPGHILLVLEVTDDFYILSMMTIVTTLTNYDMNQMYNISDVNIEDDNFELFHGEIKLTQ